mmetsp:Transcript_34218/g.82387  ORF Transcript_34218/g.82387 Transcript_34218/m.82387 type:complete len:561 (-) Transcript_34218:213-1895(-)
MGAAASSNARSENGSGGGSIPSNNDNRECQVLLSKCEMFQKLSPSQLDLLASKMKLVEKDKGETFLYQGDPCKAFHVMRSGQIRRDFVDEVTGKSHQVQFEIQAQSINSMRILSGDKLHNSVTCVGNSGDSGNTGGESTSSSADGSSSDGCEMYEMPRDKFLDLLYKNPDLGIGISAALSMHVRLAHKKYRTPILEQKSVALSSQGLNIPAVILAAGVESYYRSALNARINYALTGVKAAMFPNMHLQVPVRISYILGFKGVRQYIDNNILTPDRVGAAAAAASSATASKAAGSAKSIDDDDDSHTSHSSNIVRRITASAADTLDEAASSTSPSYIRLIAAIMPGVIMTPISSLLEASNAGHLNPEPMHTRWLRGIVARCGREIIFGLGLNQMSDYFEEYYAGNTIGTLRENPMLANAAGSLTAGVVSGYLSHVPHNISTYKLLEPNKSYAALYSMFVDKSVPAWMDNIIDNEWKLKHDSKLRTVSRYVSATLFPRGLAVRTVQIVGSFMILNGTINYLQLLEHQKIQLAKKQALDHETASIPTQPAAPTRLATAPSSSR